MDEKKFRILDKHLLNFYDKHYQTINVKIKFFFLAFMACIYQLTAAQDLSKYINPMIGTAAHGHTFPGPTLPFGLVQISPDARVGGWDWCSGYNYIDSTIIGFSHTHLSGTGISDLGDVLIVPTTGALQFTAAKENKPEDGHRSRFDHKDEKASAGYYSVLLQDHNILAELTCTQRAGMHRYTFPQSDSANILIDLGHTIYDGNRGNIIDSKIGFEDNKTISGYKMTKGWAPFRKLFYVIQFSKPFDTYGTARRNNVKYEKGGPIVGRVSFRTTKGEQVLLKVGISVVSLANARENLKEIPDWNFEAVVQNAKNVWNKELQKVKVEGTEEQKQIFYTALYHSLIAPNNIADKNGQYTGPDFNVHTSKSGSYYSTFSLWDTYRGLHPLLTITHPKRVSEMVNNMLDHFDHIGYLPMWTLMGTENYCMIANHSVPVITDAYLKGIQGIDGKRAFAAIKSSLTKDHKESNWSYLRYDSLGYVSHNLESASISKTLEFSYNDWCAAQMAAKHGQPSDYNYFMRRASFYKNIFHPKHLLSWPKDDKGTWMEDFNPSIISYKSTLTEANSWQYTWSVQHDVKGLMKLFPSKDVFIKMLDSAFSETHHPASKYEDVTGLIGQYAHGNEPSHHVAYLYNYAGQPWKTQELTRKIMERFYTTKPDGIIGNEDCGQMSAWYVLSAVGLYPVNPASGVYDFGSPMVSRAEFNLDNGKKFIITANKVSPQNKYIQNIRLNGKPYNKLFITHANLLMGGSLQFEMGPEPNKKLMGDDVEKSGTPAM